MILWALARELRVLANIALQYSQGTPLDKAFSLMLIGVPFALIVRQPDLGTALLVLAGGAFVLFELDNGLQQGLLPVFSHQLELFDFLRGSQKVAFNPRGYQLHGVMGGGQLRRSHRV